MPLTSQSPGPVAEGRTITTPHVHPDTGAQSVHVVGDSNAQPTWVQPITPSDSTNNIPPGARFLVFYGGGQVAFETLDSNGATQTLTRTVNDGAMWPASLISKIRATGTTVAVDAWGG